MKTHHPKYYPKNKQNNKNYWFIAIQFLLNEQQKSHGNDFHRINTKSQQKETKIRVSTSLVTAPIIWN